MRHIRPAIVAGAFLVVVPATTVLIAETAPAVAVAVVSTSPVLAHEKTTVQKQDALSYWTTERRGQASGDPWEEQAPSNALAPTGPPLGLPPGAGEVTFEGMLRQVTGKIFAISHTGDDYTCSAVVINSANRDLIATAAHCVYRDGEWAEKVIFVPGFDGEKDCPGEGCPLGIWTAREMAASSTWADASDKPPPIPHDVAFVALETNNDQHINDVAGGMEAGFNQRIENDSIIEVGYPAALANGKAQIACQAPAAMYQFERAEGTWYVTECGELMQQGASGGPWVINFDPATGTGVLVAVTSLVAGPNSFGAPFDEAASRVYEIAQNSTVALSESTVDEGPSGWNWLVQWLGLWRLAQLLQIG